MHMLWNSDDPVLVRDGLEELERAQSIAHTKVLTCIRHPVLKDVLEHERRGRTCVYRLAPTRAQDTADLMEEVLSTGGNSHATLMHFVEQMSTEDVVHLREWLARLRPIDDGETRRCSLGSRDLGPRDKFAPISLTQRRTVDSSRTRSCSFRVAGAHDHGGTGDRACGSRDGTADLADQRQLGVPHRCVSVGTATAISDSRLDRKVSCRSGNIVTTDAARWGRGAAPLSSPMMSPPIGST